VKFPKKLQRGNKPKNKVIVILGPNASGKSDLAIQIAKKYNGEIISADSRQIYKGLDIGSGKVTSSEMDDIKHYLIDVENPKKVFTVSDFQKKGKRILKKIIKKKKLPIIAGGTGFYIDALIYDLYLPVVPPQKELRERLEKISSEELFSRLKKIDPKRAKSIDKKNKRRLVRAVEIVETTGLPIPEIEKKTSYKILKIGIKHDNEVLKKRINTRLKKRIDEGMVDEVKELHEDGLSWDRLDDLGLEYRYVARFLQGFLSKEEMLETLETEIWRYAKRQMTWFKKDHDIIWIDPKPNDRTSAQQKAFPIIQDFLSRGA